MTSIAQVTWTYKARGFQVCNILVDGAFECYSEGYHDYRSVRQHHDNPPYNTCTYHANTIKCNARAIEIQPERRPGNIKGIMTATQHTSTIVNKKRRHEEWKRALKYLMFLKEKRDGTQKT